MERRGEGRRGESTVNVEEVRGEGGVVWAHTWLKGAGGREREKGGEGEGEREDGEGETGKGLGGMAEEGLILLTCGGGGGSVWQVHVLVESDVYFFLFFFLDGFVDCYVHLSLNVIFFK